MNIYIFPSTSLENIQIGINHGMWAVAPIDEPYATARITRAHDVPIHSAGIFYCSDPQVFTTPFRIESLPTDTTVHDIWGEPWYLPFSIRTIGDLSQQVTLSHVKNTWPVLENESNASHVLNLSGAMAFAPTWIQRRNWDIILEQLHIDVDQYEELFP